MLVFNKISVGLDLTHYDETILRFLGLFIKDADVKAIELIHIQRKQEIPYELTSKFPELIDQLSPEKIIEQYRSITDAHLPEKQITCKILEGPFFHELNEHFSENEIDLFVCGNKNKEHRKSISPFKLARKCGVNILMVPENIPLEMKKVMVPVDFSAQSKVSLLYALEMAKTGNMSIECYHCFDIPTGYTKTGISKKEFSKIMHKNTEENWKEFSQGIHFEGVNFETIFEESEGQYHGNQIYSVAVERNHDLIIIGSHGRTNLAALFLGSTTEKLIEHDRSVPVLIIKDREKVLSAWEALKKL